mmetsp:Transcript_30879/g.61143  ORF Transcript_30879/g.61143 Transcript_30879/m.61143 type:complete len:494 (-) Transcript_30879:222-1703(-)
MSIHADDHQGGERKSFLSILVAPAQQRLRWGETQISPHVVWADLFYDLFYVAAAYNCGYILYYHPNMDGLLYFLGCYGPTYSNFWFNKLIYDSKFENSGTFASFFFDAIQMLLLACSVLHTQNAYYMSKGSKRYMWVFCAANTAAIFLYLSRYIQIALGWVRNADSAKTAAKFEIIRIIPTFATMICATTIAYQTHQTYSAKSDYDGGNSDFEKVSRMLAGNKYEIKDPKNMPIYLCLATWFIDPITRFFVDFVLISKETYKARDVPIHVEYVSHRYMEFTMLMLGESVLSLLIVNIVPTEDYYLTFIAGVISIILLTNMHLSSQPHHGENQALFRRERRFPYMVINKVYCACLVTVGVGFKLLLYEVIDTEKYCDTEDNFIAKMFSVCLALACLSLDIMIVSHNGIKRSLERLRHPETNQFLSGSFFIIIASRLVIYFMLFTMFTQVKAPQLEAMLGLLVLVVLTTIRGMGRSMYPVKDIHASAHHFDEVVD